MDIKKILILVVVIFLAIVLYKLGLNEYLNLNALKSFQTEWTEAYHQKPAEIIAIYFLIYVVVTGLSLPGATLMTLVGGAMFGLAMGVLIISFASTIGATIAFLLSRYLFRDWVQTKFARQLLAVNEGIEKEGSYYLFTLRLVPLFPFFIINMVMGLTPIKTFSFYWVSQVGMFLGTIVYVNAGTQLAKLDGVAGILSTELIISFSLIGLLPLVTKKLVDFINARKIYKPYQDSRPNQFDTNLVVIGGGAAGLVSSYIASAVKAKVTLVEQGKMGGDCLNTGCVPSKSLIRAASLLNDIKTAENLGLKNISYECHFSEVMLRVRQIVKEIEPHDSVERYTELGVECISGHAKITSPWCVEVNGNKINTKNIIIASGAEPFVPDIPGIDKVSILTSDNIWNLESLPRRLAIMGGGPIACELGQCFARLGSEVTIVEMLPEILSKEDNEVSKFLESLLLNEGVKILTKHEVIEIAGNGEERKLICNCNGEKTEIACDQLLVAVGRKARVNSMGLEELGIEFNTDATIKVNEFMQTCYPNIYACGDVAGPYQFTHVASHQAWYAVVNSLFGIVKKFRVDYSVIPWCTFTDPQVARVGLNEKEAQSRDLDYEVTRFELKDLDRAIIEGKKEGFIKVLTVPGKDKILGVTVVGYKADDMLAEFVLAMKHGIGLNKLLSTLHIYPTMMEANKYVSGEWKKSTSSDYLLSWIERFHQWRLK